MRPNNPACYECPKDQKGIHTWSRNSDGTATCVKCGHKLSRADADDVWYS